MPLSDQSAMVPPKVGGEASLKEQKEAGLEQGDTDSSWHKLGLMRLLVPVGGDWQKEGLRPHPLPALLLTNPMVGVEVVAMEVTIGRRPGRLRKREGRREEETVGPPGPPRRM